MELLPPLSSSDRPSPEDIVLRLPTRQGRALASSPLIDEPPPDEDSIAIAPWRVTGCRLPASALIELLMAASRSGPVLVPGVGIGADLAYWTHALRFAAALIARERFIPALSDSPEGFVARWEPVVAGEDVDRLRELAASMPDACRALARDVSSAPSRSSNTILLSFVWGIVDHLARDAESPHAAKRPAADRRPAHPAAAVSSVHDRWVQALRSRNRRVEGTPEELSALAAQILEWRRRLASVDASPFILCFRLAEPEPPQGRELPTPTSEASDTAADALTDTHAPASRRLSSRLKKPRKLGRASADTREPAPESWTVQYLLQYVEDPSLLVPAADVWRATRKLSALTRAAGRGPTASDQSPPARGSRLRAATRPKGTSGQHAPAPAWSAPRTYLLQALGRAAAICPRIEASLSSREPSGYALDTAAAHEFLSERAWALRDAGFTVMLPAWWTAKGKRPALRVHARVATPSMTTEGGLSLDQLVTVNWGVLIGDDRLSRAELETLARLKAPLVRIRGQWVEVSASDRAHALRLLDGATTRTTAREMVKMALGAATTPGELELEGVEAEGWLGEVMARLDSRATVEELAPPPGFNGQLRPYQVRGYSWLAFMTQWGLGACLADDMGLGKTVQTLALIQRGWMANGARPTLLICPTSVVGNWQKEAARFTPDLPILVHHGLGRTQGAAFAKDAARHALVISSYALLHRDAEGLRQIDWRGIVLDEAQNVKNAETRQAKAARALRADYRVALTGTPVENNVGDLWSLMEFLNAGLLGTPASFKREFFVPIQVNRDADATARLKRTTGAFVLRRLKTDRSILSDLPDKLEMKVFCTLTREQASLYAVVVRDAEEAIAASDGIQRKGVVLATLSKLKQVCNHPAQFLADGSAVADRSGKLARLTEMLDEVLAANERALVFTQFAEMGALIKTHLQETFGREVLFLHGGVPKAQRDRMVERFQAPGEAPPVFVLSLKAGGTGLNLTAARHVFLFDRWWNPAVEAQAIDRAHRIGQTQRVQVHKFLCDGTLEERIDELIERKRTLAAEIVGTGEAWLTELSAQELKTLFTLRKDAVAE
jgi:superfamily II DNA or RNA helicase